ncbi:SDR family NAD(P)-dependent oxidoreductase [Nocardioides sp. CER19]|uniref:SDR family NAD(P)-dependent oxidoreductase n=1 Tax=Nocardioides sp. CER19 TaxID=3038538 RepID=UPI0024479CB7|nr:SDR family NAD(P)-dependent oxidoreductase [Nocardioides sp. CER19]MDH2414473.1 SDR family NAD(P)-dependent oxidoreductase [Nocardioides sp. CER19]
MRVAGCTSLVTGASGGIGAATARRLAAAGSRVVVHGRDAARTAAVADEVGGTPVIADLLLGTHLLDVLAARVPTPIDLLVANAGRGWSGPFTTMEPDEIAELVAVDLTAAVQLTRALLPGMVERRRGHVVFVSSIAGRAGVAGEAVYAATKAGLDAFADSLRMELRGSGVGVGVVVPAAVDTGFFAARGRGYDRRRPRPVPADLVARRIVEAVEHDRAETWVPRWTRVVPVVRAVAPGPFRALSARFGEQVAPERTAGLG